MRQATANLSTTYIDDDLKHIIDSGESVDKESWIHTIKVNGQAVAVIDKTLGEADKVSFIHRDLVGNADTVTDIHGNIMRITKADEQVPAYPVYAPYGELLGYASKTDNALEGEGTVAEQGSYREAFERKSSANDEIAEFIDIKMKETGINVNNCTLGKVCSQSTGQTRVTFTAASQASFQGQIIDQLPGFTGHETLKEHGLVHMNGRIYSPKYARFLSADPTVPYPTRWYSYNRYMYVGGNPASRYDPSGFTDLYADGQCPSCNEPPIVVTAPAPPPPQSFDQYWAQQITTNAINQGAAGGISQSNRISSTRTTYSATGTVGAGTVLGGGNWIDDILKVGLSRFNLILTVATIPGSTPQMHRGRIQAQGAGLEASVPWTQYYPPTSEEGLAMLEALKLQLTTKELGVRAYGFNKAESFIINARSSGGVYAPLSRSFLTKDTSDIRVDIEVITGRAFVP